MTSDGESASARASDRYETVAAALRWVGWIQDALLHRTRQKVVDICLNRGGHTVLDVCCGAGALSSSLSRAGLSVCGVDRSPAMLGLARARAVKATFVEGDAATLDLPAPVDISVVALALHEMDERSRERVWSAMRRLTRSRGTLILVDYVAPTGTSALSRAAASIIRQDEKGLDRDDPGRFQSYCQFMSMGGAAGWLRRHSENVIEEHRFLFGNLGVLVALA